MKIIPGPKSPDPNIPEWDWGDVEQPVSKVVAIPPINFQQVGSLLGKFTAFSSYHIC